MLPWRTAGCSGYGRMDSLNWSMTVQRTSCMLSMLRTSAFAFSVSTMSRRSRQRLSRKIIVAPRSAACSTRSKRRRSGKRRRSWSADSADRWRFRVSLHSLPVVSAKQLHIARSSAKNSIGKITKLAAIDKSRLASSLTALHNNNCLRTHYGISVRCSYLHPAERRVSAPVTGFSPFNVGFLHKFCRSKVPMAASVKSAPSTSAPSKLVPVKTALTKRVPRSDEPLKLARSTIALEKSAPSKLLSALQATVSREESTIGSEEDGNG